MSTLGTAARVQDMFLGMATECGYGLKSVPNSGSPLATVGTHSEYDRLSTARPSNAVERACRTLDMYNSVHPLARRAARACSGSAAILDQTRARVLSRARFEPCTLVREPSRKRHQRLRLEDGERSPCIISSIPLTPNHLSHHHCASIGSRVSTT